MYYSWARFHQLAMRLVFPTLLWCLVPFTVATTPFTTLKLQGDDSLVEFGSTAKAYILKDGAGALRVNNTLVVSQALQVGDKSIDWAQVEALETTTGQHGSTLSSHTGMLQWIPLSHLFRPPCKRSRTSFQK